MQIVTGDPAPVLDREEAGRLLLEMAAVVRTIFAVSVEAPVAAEQPGAQPPPTVQAPPAGRPPTVASIPVPILPIPAPDTLDSAERHSMALLQEIAFLDD